ncbi:MAG TPA: DnaD domain protein [Firmicutes bacterium]|nr:DnaD domain protein [Bacillota bacterium]
MGYKIHFAAWAHIFALPCAIVDDYLTEASGDAVKILLLIFRNQDKHLTEKQIASRLMLDEQAVREAIAYWTARGLLLQDGSEIRAEADSVQVHKNNPPQAGEIPTEELAARIQSSADFRFLAEEAGNLLGHPLTSTEAKYLLYISDSIRLPADVILMCIDYCVKIGKPGIRYISKVCETWAELGINTHETAELYLKKQLLRNQNEREVKTCFGIFDRNLTAKEQQYIEKWYTDYHYKLNMIRLAYERTIDSIGKMSFPYIDRILSDWHAKGFVVPRDISEQAPPKKSGTGNAKSADTSYDIDAFDRIELKVRDMMK